MYNMIKVIGIALVVLSAISIIPTMYGLIKDNSLVHNISKLCLIYLGAAGVLSLLVRYYLINSKITLIMIAFAAIYCAIGALCTADAVYSLRRTKPGIQSGKKGQKK